MLAVPVDDQMPTPVAGQWSVRDDVVGLAVTVVRDRQVHDHRHRH